ncbi:MAG: chemotaxis protein [Azonexus sp.]|nr:chemotaxis protein [Azonexus sp.]MDZ4315322.1 chemotaxis protein [Azonexus sp.]
MTTLTTQRPAVDTDLLRIVHINEEIKRVVGVSVKINIMALNAIFLAKRAGTAALGFGVLSNELRVFSQDLRTCMESLNGLIHACVNQVSVGLKGIRNSRLLTEAARLAPQQTSVVRILHEHEQENERRTQRLTALRRQLKGALEDVFQMVELGGVLAKSAKIEAAYGQSFAPSLAQVSGEFDGVVEEIRGSLESLRRSAFFTGNRNNWRG